VAENKYTRQSTITLVELVPTRENLPQCVGWKSDGLQCPFKARYELNDEPVCGVHVGSPNLMFMPVKLRAGARRSG
jgi:hypothetical protein